MKKKFQIITTSAICLTLLMGCSANADASLSTISTDEASIEKDVSSSSSASYTRAYNALLSYKQKDYQKETVSTFNHSLIPDDNDLSTILENYALVKESLSYEDDNYDFITITLCASIDELYSEQLNDDVTFFIPLKRVGNPVEPLNDMEEKALASETLYDFFFSADCVATYKLIDSSITVEERDNVLKTLQTELHSYVDQLETSDFTDNNIQELLLNKANEIVDKMNIQKMQLTLDLNNVSVASDKGTEKEA